MDKNYCDINNPNKSCCNSSATEIKDYVQLWDNVYEKQPTNQLGWYEENPTPSINLIESCQLSKEARILHVGAGASTLIDILLDQGYPNQIVNDLSPNALNQIKRRLGSKDNNIEWLVDDLIAPKALNKIDPIDLWHDRAVLHFFNQPEEQKTYFKLVHQLVKVNGYVIIACFNLNGASKCSGLPVSRYNAQMIQDQLGSQFKLMESFDYMYTMPSGEKRPYVYTLFRRLE